MVERSYYIGTSGFVYPHWRDCFYPRGLAQSRWLEYYAERFSTVELNVTFYRLPKETAFERWKRLTPEGFVFVVKASRLITHLKRLKGIEEALDLFLERARLLGDKLGAVLFQLPPSQHRDDALLDAFLAGLPLDIRAVVEFRHQSWFAEPVYDILRRQRAALCVMDFAKLECPFEITTDFAYLRFHGPSGRYGGCYGDGELEGWAQRLAALGPEVREVYAYFNNDDRGFAVSNALTLARFLGLGR